MWLAGEPGALQLPLTTPRHHIIHAEPKRPTLLGYRDVLLPDQLSSRAQRYEEKLSKLLGSELLWVLSAIDIHRPTTLIVSIQDCPLREIFSWCAPWP